MKRISVHFSMHLPVKVTQKEKWYLSSCPILDVHSQGETEKIAREKLIEALSLFFVSCFERGTLDAALKECGFKPANQKVEPPASPEEFIDVPIPFYINDNDLNRCHA